VYGDVLPTNEMNADAGQLVPLAAAVVSGNEVVRRGLEALLRADPDVKSVQALAHPDELVPLLEQSGLDLVIVTAAEAVWLTSFHKELAEAKVTVLVAVDHATTSDLSSYASPPADGFLWQPDLSAASLREAMRRVRGGELPMPPELTRALLSRAGEVTRRPRPGSANLTSREREALTLLVKGLSNKQIAKRLSISSHGAKRLVTSIMLKLDAPNRTLAAVTAIRVGMVEDH
jgi:two-component system nitrate/nitrite response regulator NarL